MLIPGVIGAILLLVWLIGGAMHNEYGDPNESRLDRNPCRLTALAWHRMSARRRMWNFDRSHTRGARPSSNILLCEDRSVLQSINLAAAGFLLHLLVPRAPRMGRIEIEGVDDRLRTRCALHALLHHLWHTRSTKIRATPESFFHPDRGEEQSEAVTLFVVRDISLI